MNTERSQKDLADFPVSRQPRSRRAGAGAMSQRGGFAGSGHDLWRREPARADADWEEGDEVTSDESPDAYRWGPYPFSTYSLDNEFPAATRHLARKECAREFRRYYETLQVPNVHLGLSLMSFGFMLRLLKPVLFPGVNTPVEEGWEYISDGCRVTHLGKRGALGGDRIPAEVRVPGAPGHWKAPFTPARLLVPHDDDTPDGGLQRGAPPTPETTPNKSKSKSKTQRPFNLSNVPPPSRAHSFDVSLTLSQRHTLQCPVPGGIKVELALRVFMVNGMCVAWRPNLPWMAGNRFACWAVYVHLVRKNRPGTLAWWPLVLLDFCFIVALPVFAAWGLEKKARRMFFDECAMTSVWSNGGGFRSRRSRRSSRSGVRSRSSSHGAATPRRMPSPPPLPERRSWWDGLTRRQPAQG